MLQPSKQAALYCRTASYDDFGYALDKQKLKLVEAAREQGYTNLVLYMDNGYNGLSFVRPAFAEMERAISEEYITAVFVTDISRIGRNHTDVVRWIMEIELVGADIIAIDNPNFRAGLLPVDSLLHFALNGGDEE